MNVAEIKENYEREIWQGWRDSNPQPSVLETAVLPIGTTPLEKVLLVNSQHSDHGLTLCVWKTREIEDDQNGRRIIPINASKARPAFS